MSARRRLLAIPFVTVLLTAGLLLPIAHSTRAEEQVHEWLHLEEVLEAVDRTYPLLLAIELETTLADADLLGARGAFDPRIRAQGEASPTGFYDRYTADLEIDQQTRLWGSRIFAGYRIGRGDFPSYLGGRKTNESGEFRAGVDVPLLRDGSIDPDRLELRVNEIRKRGAEPSIELQRISIVREASETYWRWVAAGQNVKVEKQLLSTAEARRDQLEGLVRNGALSRIVLVDNRRLIVDREIRLNQANQKFREASLELSLFMRDSSGNPLLLGFRRLPLEFPTETVLGEERIHRDIEWARTSHPLVRVFRFRLDEVDAQLELARNSALPDVSLRLEASQDFGRSSSGIDSSGSLATNPKDDSEIKALLRFEIPVLQRRARGDIAGRRVELNRLRHELRFATDQIETEIRRASTNVETAFAQTILARQNVELAGQLQIAEERKLVLGSSNLIDVNIREIQATDAARVLIVAQADYFRSLARYEAAVASGKDG